MNKDIIIQAITDLEESFNTLIESLNINDNEQKDIILKNIEVLKNNFFEKKEKSYLEAVQNMAVTNTNYEFGYKGLDHAVTVFKLFIEHSKSTINIFHKDLNNEVFNSQEFLFYLENYLKSKSLNLFIIKTEINDSKALELILKYTKINDKIIVNYASDTFIDNAKNLFTSGRNYNFIVSGSSFILETGSKKIEGLCNFQDKEIAKKLNRLF